MSKVAMQFDKLPN